MTVPSHDARCFWSSPSFLFSLSPALVLSTPCPIVGNNPRTVARDNITASEASFSPYYHLLEALLPLCHGLVAHRPTNAVYDFARRFCDLANRHADPQGSS